MTKKYKVNGEGFKGPCGHRYPDVIFSRAVELTEGFHAFHAIEFKCRKCKKTYLEPLNIAQLSEPLQNYLLENKTLDGSVL